MYTRVAGGPAKQQPRPRKENSHHVASPAAAGERAQVGALIVSLVGCSQHSLACVLCWDQGLLTRQASLLHWLVVGVLPPALALWTMEVERTRR